MFSAVYTFVWLHRLVVLMAAVVVMSVFSIYLMAREVPKEVNFTRRPRHVPEDITQEVLPPKPLDPWGEDPFKDVLYHEELTRRKAQEEKRIQDAQAAKERERKKQLRQQREKARKTELQEAQMKKLEERRHLLELAKEHLRRRKVILSVRISGIVLGSQAESIAIIDGKPYRVGEQIVTRGVEFTLQAIESNGVIFRDPESGDTYNVPISR